MEEQQRFFDQSHIAHTPWATPAPRIKSQTAKGTDRKPSDESKQHELVPAKSGLFPLPTRLPKFESSETENEYLMSVDLPGIPKANIKVEVDDDNGVMHVVEHSSTTDKDGTYSSSFRKFERSFTLPKNSNADAMTAKHENGVLCLRLPKREQASRKQVTIA